MPQSDFLRPSDNPLSESEWHKLSETAICAARRTLVGRRFLDLYGPLGAGAQALPHDQFPAAGAGTLDLPGEAEAGQLFAESRRFKALPILYKDFLLHWRDLEAARSQGLPLDASAAAGAAADCAQREDALIFFGDPKLGFEGLLNATGRQTASLGDWNKAGTGFENVFSAIEKLSEAGHFGPYAAVLSPRLFGALNRVFEKTGVLELDSVRRLVAAGVFPSPQLKGSSGVVLSTGAENLDLAVAMDLSVAFLGQEKMNLPFRVLEMVALRIKRPGAVCTLEGGRGAR